jgi:hypothetical protein
MLQKDATPQCATDCQSLYATAVIIYLCARGDVHKHWCYNHPWTIGIQLLAHSPTCRSKAEYSEAAKSAGIPAIISAGIYPGTSNVMAADIIASARKEYDEKTGEYRTPAPGEPGLVLNHHQVAGSRQPCMTETTAIGCEQFKIICYRLLQHSNSLFAYESALQQLIRL